MQDERFEKLIGVFAETLPPLSDSINNLINYVQNDGKLGEEAFTRIFLEVMSEMKNISTNLKKPEINSIIYSNTTDEVSLMIHQLYLEYLQGADLILTGCKKLGFLILKERNSLEEAKKANYTFLEEFNENNPNITVESAIEDIYSGTKKVFKVIEKAFD